ncbi:MAG: hypothetical protein KY475_27290, partial [Planctomycetes bacterium]|nr:hypothetical protein [Planctomycetota bacterium]
VYGPTIQFLQFAKHSSIRFKPEWLDEFIEKYSPDPAAAVELVRPARKAPSKANPLDDVENRKEYREGRRAARSGRPKSENPYSAGWQAYYWNRGWDGPDENVWAYTTSAEQERRCKESAAYQQGQKAARLGRSERANPYRDKIGTAKYEYWLAGWKDAKKEMRAAGGKVVK